MKGFGIAFLCGLLIVVVAYVKIDKIELLDLHNDARSGRAMALEMNLYCDEAAQDHANWMAEHNVLSHDGIRGSSVGDRLKKPYGIVGENIAAGQSSPSEVTRDWLNSPGHRRNITNPRFKYVGFGIATARDGTVYWCSVFSD
jgi:uncharacterized protein YkwD